MGSGIDARRWLTFHAGVDVDADADGDGNGDGDAVGLAALATFM